MEKELHSIKPFRGGKLGVIRLNNLAYADKKKMKIHIGNRVFKPIGFDTYGHPIISADNFKYYQALKSITERKGESLVPVVEYEKKPFCIRRECYDSAEAIEKTLNSEVTDEMNENEMLKVYEKSLDEFKRLLIFRKHAAFCHMELDEFIVLDFYFLAKDGKIYECKNAIQPTNLDEHGNLLHPKAIKASEARSYEVGKEIHIPSSEDVCAVCGRNFSILDVEDFSISET